MEPPAGLTLPTPWLIEAEVALVRFQLKLELFPVVIVPGLAEKLLILGSVTGAEEVRAVI